jgi:iron complex outermembrane recepter protein
MHDNITAMRKLFNGTGDKTGIDPMARYSNQETTFAIYGKAKYGFSLGGIPVDGTVGVRVVKTDSELNGYSKTNDVTAPVSSKPSSTDVLPNFTMKAKVLADVQARVTAGKTIQRAAFDQFNPGVSYNVPSSTVLPEGTGGNPDLKPIEGKNFDAALEWYFSPTGSITGTLYHHKFKNYIVVSSTKETYGGIVYDVKRPRNLNKGTLEGAELSYQQFYDKLPGWMSGLGLQANVTYMKGELTDAAGKTSPFADMSRLSYNIVGLYEKDGWSGRIAYNWRDKYVDTFNYRGLGLNVVVDPIETVDASISYKISKNMSLTLDVENMLDRTYNDYHGIASNPRDIRRYDRTVGLALRWKM